MLIDLHAHIIPLSFLNEVTAGKAPEVTLQGGKAEGAGILSFGGRPHPCTPLFYDAKRQIEFMDEKGIDMQAISVSPRLFLYNLEAAQAKRLCRICNDEILQRAKTHPDRFIPVGGLPMQDASAALEELEYLHRNKVSIVQIGTSIGDKTLDAPEFEVLYQRLAAYHMVLMLHPLIENSDPRTKMYHMSNIVGNPMQTTAAAGNLILSGLLDRVAELQVFLVHGGGFLPYQIGRMDHAAAVRPAKEHCCEMPPSFYLQRNFIFDGLTHSTTALQLLWNEAGVTQLCFGSDYPYDMADYRQLDHLKSFCNDPREIEMFACGNALRILEKAAE